MPDLSILIRNKGSGTEKEEENKTLLNNQNEIEIEGSLPLHSTLASTPFLFSGKLYILSNKMSLIVNLDMFE